MQEKKFGTIRYDRPDYAAYSQRIAKYASDISGAGTIDELSHALEEFLPTGPALRRWKRWLLSAAIKTAQTNFIRKRCSIPRPRRL